ncbi:unnamed protein product [Arabidopsis halleri]
MIRPYGDNLDFSVLHPKLVPCTQIPSSPTKRWPVLVWLGGNHFF